MVDRRVVMMGIAAVLATPIHAGAAESDRLLATVDKPATAVIRQPVERTDQPTRVAILVTGYTPPQDGSTVQGVVKARTDTSPEQELGRFRIFPDDAEFKAPDRSAAQRFSFALPKEWRGQITLSVHLVPLRGGSGKGARLELSVGEVG